MRITFITGSMRAGGAERVTATLANYWAKAGQQVDILNLSQEPSSFYKLESNTNYESLNIGTRGVVWPLKLFKLISTVLRLRQLLCNIRPNVIVAVSDQIAMVAILATLGTKIPVLAWEHTLPKITSLNLTAKWILNVFNFLRKLIYRRATAIVLLSESARSFFGARLQSIIKVIPNPVLIEQSSQLDVKNKLPENFILGMGRLHVSKRFDLLINAFSKIATKYPDWNLMIAGEGGERPRLEGQIVKLGLTGRVHLIGLTKTPHALMRLAKIFVLSSDYEGFPMVLLEAMACGCAVVSTDCPTGPKEIISNGQDGLLVAVGDSDSLAQAIQRLVNNETESSQFSKKAIKIAQKYNLERIDSLWESQILSKI